MNKWIAEFELEDGDTMPEHMDLEYRGTRINFHCKPLEQEPFINKPCVSSGVCEHDKQKILDKIRAEIESLSNANPSYWHSGDMVEREEVFEIIDKYKAETEDT